MWHGEELTQATPLARTSSVLGDCHQRLSLNESLYPSGRSFQRLLTAVWCFKIFNLSALTWFNDFQSSPWRTPLFSCGASFWVLPHTHAHAPQTHSMYITAHIIWKKCEEKIQLFFFLYLCYLFIYLFQARRRLLYVMYISFRSSIYMHFVSSFSFVFFFLCNIIHRLV